MVASRWRVGLELWSSVLPYVSP